MNGSDGWVNDKAVPLLSRAPPQVRERDHDESHAADMDETSKESEGGLMSQMGPGRVETFFVPQKLHATGRDGPRRDRLSLFLLYYRVWSQSGRNLKPC